MSADFCRASCQLIPPDSGSNSCALLSSRITAVTSYLSSELCDYTTRPQVSNHALSVSSQARSKQTDLTLQHCNQLFCDHMQTALITEGPFVISGTSGVETGGTWSSFCSFDLFKLGVEHFLSAQFLQPSSPTRLTRITSFNTMTCRFTVAIENWPINLVGHSDAITIFGML